MSTLVDSMCRRAVAEAGWRMVEMKLTTGLDSGDASLFDRESGRIYALPAPSDRLPIRSWSDVRPEDVAIVDIDGLPAVGSLSEATVELPMHLAIYRARSDVNAIVHSHAEDSQVFAAVERDIPTFTIDSYTRSGFGPIRCGGFGVVASQELGEQTVRALGASGNAALLARHGAVAVGLDLEDALFTASVIEKAARQALRIVQLGETPDQLKLEHIFDAEVVRDIRDGRVELDTQTVTIRQHT